MNPASARRLLAAFGIAVVLLLLLEFTSSRSWIQGDTRALDASARNIQRCLHGAAPLPCARVDPFAPLQYIPSVALLEFGFSDDDIYGALWVLNVIALLGVYVIAYLVLGPKGSGTVLLCWIVLFASPLFWYAGTTFSEPLAACLIMAYTAAVLLRWPPWAVLLTLIVAGLTKETSPPVLGVLGLASWSYFASARARAMHLITLAMGGATLVVTYATINWFRYGWFGNADELMSYYRAPGWWIQVNYFLAQWLSPAAGLLFFWPAFVLVVAVAVYHLARHRAEGTSWWPAIAAFGVLGTLTLGLSLWWQPFGWYGWGPRLIVSWIPAVLLVILFSYAPQLQVILRGAYRRRIVFALVAVCLTLATFPQYSVLFDDEIVLRMLGPNTLCPVPVPLEQDPLGHAVCELAVIWPDHYPLQAAYPPLIGRRTTGQAALFSLVLLLSLLGLRRLLLADE
jgi:hypothetical protein